MKKIFLIFLLGINITLVSQGISREEVKINNLLKAGGYSDELFSELFKLSLELDRNEREYLYQRHSVPVALPTTLNVILGFGIGSFAQNDQVWGGIFAVTDIVGTGTVLVSFSTLAIYSLWIPVESLSGSDTPDFAIVAEQALIYSFIGLGVSKVFQIIRPIYFGYSVNNRLWKALNLDIELGPTISPSNRFSYTLSATIRI